MPTVPANPEPRPPASAERWVIVLRDAGGSEVLVGRRVAGTLKSLLRGWKLRAVSVSSTTPDEQLERLRDENLELRRQLAQAKARAARPKRKAATA